MPKRGRADGGGHVDELADRIGVPADALRAEFEH